MAMEGGTGSYSYARNSNLQAVAFQFLAPAIAEAIHSNFAVFKESKLVRVADIGCSSGPNTIASVDFVMQELVKGFQQHENKTSFQVFFSDLPSNDFNTLFKLLSQKSSQGKPYFYSAIPGSFSGRLFPGSSIHFAMSNFALHILSKVPPIENPRVLVDDRSSKEIIEAYAQQAHEDLCSFLNNRAEEIVPGGILSCFLLGKKTFNEKSSPWFDLFQEAWEELVAEGFISQESLNSFNLMTYRRTVDEVQKAIEGFECFKTIRVEHKAVKGPSPDPRVYAGALKAVTRRNVVEHFKGDENLTEQLYKKIDRKIAAGTTSFEGDHFTFISFVLLRV